MFEPSCNDYDWLGRGAYFWEYGPDRALQWAEANKEYPAVVGAYIQLGKCFDLMDTRFTGDLAEFAQNYIEHLRSGNKEIPKNRGKARYFDCALLNSYLDGLESEGIPFDTVRCGFAEGGPVYRNDELGVGMEIQKKTHIQVAVRNHKCILGVFRPFLR